MSDRQSYYFKQAVTESELNKGFTDAENAEHNLMIDQGLYGIFSGGAAAQHNPLANLSVDIAGPMASYDPAGQRVFIGAATTVVDCSQDSSSVSTTVAGGGNEKWVSITAKFIRVLSDPRIDGNSMTVYFEEDESFQLVVAQGAEAAVGFAPKPTLDPNGILLVDVHRTFGQTQIFNGDLDITRRQDTFVFTGSPLSIRAGTAKGAVQAMLNTLNTHVTGGGHPATAITTVASGTWADGATTLPGTNVQADLNAVVSDLGANSGATLIGAPATGTLVAGQLSVQLAALETGRAANATAVTEVVADLAYSWLGKFGAASATKMRRGAYSAVEQAWYAVGATGLDQFLRSADGGRSWVDKSGTLGSGEECMDIAFDDVGNGVILIWGTRNVYSGIFGSYNSITWTHENNVISVQMAVGAPTSGSGGIVWDGTHSKFVTVFLATAGGIKSNSSSNAGVSWTAHAMPVAWDTYASTNIPELAARVGGTIIATMLMGTTPHVAYSTDGGTTWTDVAITPNTITPTTMTKAVYSANDGAWYVAFCSTGPNQTEIWKSVNDGVTWTMVLVLTAADFAIDDLEVIDASIGTFLGSQLVGYARDGRVYMSIDKGLHWRLVVNNPQTAAMRLWMRSGGGQVMSWNSTDNLSYASGRIGTLGHAIN